MEKGIFTSVVIFGVRVYPVGSKGLASIRQESQCSLWLLKQTVWRAGYRVLSCDNIFGIIKE